MKTDQKVIVMPSQPTYSPKPGEIERHWHVIDANDVVLGRLASQAATLLRGKHKPQFALHVDTGDFVVVVNAVKVAVTGAKLDELRYRHSGYPGGLSSRTVGELLETKPERVIELAVTRHAAQEHPGPRPAQEAEGLRRPRAPARGPASRSRTTIKPFASDKPSPRAVARRCTRCQEHSDPVTTSPTPAAPVGRPPQGGRRPRPPRARHRRVQAQRPHPRGYFPNKVHQQLIREPFVTLEKDGQYDVIATLIGGGITGQAGALRLGIARALIEIEPDDRPALKKAGFLTRDPRAKERKKYGLKKARKAPQYSKR